jgi:hypothetical protein
MKSTQKPKIPKRFPAPGWQRIPADGVTLLRPTDVWEDFMTFDKYAGEEKVRCHIKGCWRFYSKNETH